jgi:hypothetical protein
MAVINPVMAVKRRITSRPSFCFFLLFFFILCLTSLCLYYTLIIYVRQQIIARKPLFYGLFLFYIEEKDVVAMC